MFSPTGYGRQAWVGDEKKRTQIRRRFALIGQPWDSVCLNDLRSFIRRAQSSSDADTEIHAHGKLAWLTLMAACIESESAARAKLVLTDLSTDRDQIPVWRLGGLGITPVELLALASHRQQVELVAPSDEIRSFVTQMAGTVSAGHISIRDTSE